ncbi:DUF2306 domain-containing protein [Maricaulis sp. D1M11]|uniref:DUF2306 domain-containing protein n=1 Tax=Maricaulis sp. D1M11 TaxID=3076117 RepID=UPI0039B3A570
MRRVGFGLIWFLCAGVSFYAAQYWSGWTFVPGFNPVRNLLGEGALALHAGFGSLALVTGPFQFSSRLRNARPGVHRWTGMVYMMSCTVSGLAGLALAFGSVETLVAKLGFGTLAVFWLTTIAMGYRTALGRRFVQHRQWMWRSMALTFAAVTLRILLPLGMMTGHAFSDVYAVIAWMCWVPNLLAVELVLRLQPRLARQRSAA